MRKIYLLCSFDTVSYINSCVDVLLFHISLTDHTFVVTLVYCPLLNQVETPARFLCVLVNVYLDLWNNISSPKREKIHLSIEQVFISITVRLSVCVGQGHRGQSKDPSPLLLYQWSSAHREQGLLMGCDVVCSPIYHCPPHCSEKVGG